MLRYAGYRMLSDRILRRWYEQFRFDFLTCIEPAFEPVLPYWGAVLYFLNDFGDGVVARLAKNGGVNARSILKQKNSTGIEERICR